MNPARFRFWGVRGSFPAARPGCRLLGGNTSCVQVEWQGHHLILDAGTGIRKLGDALMQNPPSNPLHLLITHPHWDHIQGFPFFAPANRPDTELHIHSVERPVKLQSLLADQQQTSFFGVPLKKMASTLHFHEWAEGVPFQVGPFELQTWRLNHPGICSGWRIRAGDQVLAYVTDVAPTSSMRLTDPYPESKSEFEDLDRLQENQHRLTQGAQSVIYDTFFTTEQYSQFPSWGHSTLEHATAVCRQTDVANLFTFHHNSEIDDRAQLQRLSDYQALKGDPKLRAACEGNSYTFDGQEADLCA